MKSSPSVYSAITGDSKLLAVLTSSGELARLFWPHVDYGQHVEQHRVGISMAGENPTWLDEPDWTRVQFYLPGTNIIQTEAHNSHLHLFVRVVAFAVPNEDRIVFRYTLFNTAESRDCRLFLYEHFRINELPYYQTVFFDQQSGTLVFYFRDTAIATIGSFNPDGFQCSTMLKRQKSFRAIRGELQGGIIQHRDPEGALMWDIGTLKEGVERHFTISVVLATNHREAVKKALSTVLVHPAEQQAAVEGYWRKWLGVEKPERLRKKGDPVQPNDFEILDPGRLAEKWRLPELAKICGKTSADVFLRSLLALKLLSDRETGAIIAAPEFDREREVCGGYGYTWGRDAAFLSHALGLAGMTGEAEAFFDYACRIQEPDGVWLHRHYSTGELAPSWGLIQIDETAAIIWGMVKHYAITKNKTFLERMWDSISRGADYLCGSLDEETGLPAPSYELWEENFCESIYAAAAVAGGLKAAAETDAIVGDGSKGRRWLECSDGIKDAIQAVLWNPTRKTYFRSVKRMVKKDLFDKLVGDGADGLYIECQQGSLYPAFYQSQDPTIDVSLLGLVFPFDVFAPDEEQMRLSARAVAKYLTVAETGGLLRYENDKYVGGNPWILTTLWLAIYHLKLGNDSKAAQMIRWAAKHTTGRKLLTEQVDKETGEPIWAVPLGWSHAMFIIASLMLVGAVKR